MMKLKSILRKLFAPVFLFLMAEISHNSILAQTAAGWQASKETVEKLSKNQSEFNYYEDKVPAYTLPSLLTSGSGKLITNSEDWVKIRRPEILELFRTYVYGRIPSTLYKTTFNVISEDPGHLMEPPL